MQQWKWFPILFKRLVVVGCVAIIWTKKKIFLFDSHSRNSLGQPVPDGFSILLKFKNKKELVQHIIATYIAETDIHIQYELQNVAIEIDKTVDFSISYTDMKECKRKSTQEAKGNSRARSATETQKEKSRARSASEIQKAKTRDRKNTIIEKEKCRKRKSTDSEKAKCRERNTYAAKKIRKESKTRVSAFHEAIQDGPYFICIVCNRTLYKKTVKLFHKNSYNPNMHYVFTNVNSFNSKYYICITCDKHLKKDEIPCQAVWNKLEISDLPAEIKVLNILERVLISKRILFKKIVIMPKGQQPKIKGAICNIPIQVYRSS